MKLMVIDGNSILNRAYYGIRPHHAGRALHPRPSSLPHHPPARGGGGGADAVCVTFDVHAPTFRHKASEAYKATRKPMPEELRVQVPVLKEVLDALNIPRYELEGWEADDLIGTISRRCEAAGWDCGWVTGDKDSLQLITDHNQGEAGLHPHGADHEGHDGGCLPGAVRLRPHPHDRPEGPDGGQLRQHPRRPRHRGKDRHGPDPEI